MADKSFNPYQQWFGIPRDDQPPNHYRLLGLQQFEDSLTEIEDAVARRVEFLQALSMGEHVKSAQQILNEVAMARICLVNPQRKREYDEQLRNPEEAQKPIPFAKTVDTNSIIQTAVHDLEVALELRKSKSRTQPPQAPPGSSAAKTPADEIPGEPPRLSKPANRRLVPLAIGIALCLIATFVGVVLWNSKSDQPIAKEDRMQIPEIRQDQNVEPNVTPSKANENSKAKSAAKSKNKPPSNNKVKPKNKTTQNATEPDTAAPQTAPKEPVKIVAVEAADSAPALDRTFGKLELAFNFGFDGPLQNADGVTFTNAIATGNGPTYGTTNGITVTAPAIQENADLGSDDLWWTETFTPKQEPLTLNISGLNPNSNYQVQVLHGDPRSSFYDNGTVTAIDSRSNSDSASLSFGGSFADYALVTIQVSGSTSLDYKMPEAGKRGPSVAGVVIHSNGSPGPDKLVQNDPGAKTSEAKTTPASKPVLTNPNLIFTESFEGPKVSLKTNQVPENWVGARNKYKAESRGLYNENSGNFTTPYGEQAVWVGYHTAGVTTSESILNDVLEAGVKYTVWFNTASDREGATRSYRVELVALHPNDARNNNSSGTVLAQAKGNVSSNDMSKSVSFSFEAKAQDPNLGKPLAISLESGNEPVLFDNVILSRGSGDLPATIVSAPSPSNNTAPDSENSKSTAREKIGKVVVGKPFWTPGNGVQAPEPFQAVTGDLLETHLAKITRDGGAAFDKPRWHNGVTDVGNAYDVTDGHGENGVEIHFDITNKPGGFDIAEIRVFTAGVDLPSGSAQVSQSFSIFYQTADKAGSHDNSTFIKLGDVRAEPEGASTVGGILMTGSYNNRGGPLLRGVSAILLATKNAKGASGTNLAFTKEWIQEIDIIEYSGRSGQTATLARRGFLDFKKHFDLPALTDLAATKIDDLKVDPSIPLSATLHFKESWSTPSANFEIRKAADDQPNWVISKHASKNESPQDVAKLWIESEAMFFRWVPAAQKDANVEYLRNGVLDFSTDESLTHRLNFRSPVVLGALQFSNREYSAKHRTELQWLPGNKDLQIKLSPSRIDKTAVHCQPSLVSNKPAKMFFSKNQSETFLWLELDGSVRQNRLTLEAELKLSVPDRRGKPRSQTFNPELLENQIASLNQAIKQSTQRVATTKDPGNKKLMQAMVEQAKKTLSVFQSYQEMVPALSNQSLDVEVFYEIDGHPVVIAKTGSDQE